MNEEDKMKQINFLFLDFDGVLNTEKYQCELRLNGKQVRDSYGPLFDPSSVLNLKKIIELTSAKICLISSWCFEGEDKMKQLWKYRNMPGEIYAICSNIPTLNIDKTMLTGQIQDFMVGKGRDINAFLNNITSPYNYAILDDVPDFYLDQMNHYVCINPLIGINDSVVEKVLNILNVK